MNCAGENAHFALHDGTRMCKCRQLERDRKETSGDMTMCRFARQFRQFRVRITP